MAKTFLYLLGVIALTLGVSFAATDDEKTTLRAAVRPILEACGQELGISNENIQTAKKTGNIDNLDPCFYACFFKKVGFVDEKGLFVPFVAVEKNKKYFKSEEDIKHVEQVSETCTSVNEQTVSDGVKGCERSKLLLSCFIKEKAIFTPLATS